MDSNLGVLHFGLRFHAADLEPKRLERVIPQLHALLVLIHLALQPSPKLLPRGVQFIQRLNLARGAKSVIVAVARQRLRAGLCLLFLRLRNSRPSDTPTPF